MTNRNPKSRFLPPYPQSQSLDQLRLQLAHVSISSTMSLQPITGRQNHKKTLVLKMGKKPSHKAAMSKWALQQEEVKLSKINKPTVRSTWEVRKILRERHPQSGNQSHPRVYRNMTGRCCYRSYPLVSSANKQAIIITLHAPEKKEQRWREENSHTQYDSSSTTHYKREEEEGWR